MRFREGRRGKGGLRGRGGSGWGRAGCGNIQCYGVTPCCRIKASWNCVYLLFCLPQPPAAPGWGFNYLTHTQHPFLLSAELTRDLPCFLFQLHCSLRPLFALHRVLNLLLLPHPHTPSFPTPSFSSSSDLFPASTPFNCSVSVCLCVFLFIREARVCYPPVFYWPIRSRCTSGFLCQGILTSPQSWCSSCWTVVFRPGWPSFSFRFFKGKFSNSFLTLVCDAEVPLLWPF